MKTPRYHADRGAFFTALFIFLLARSLELEVGIWGFLFFTAAISAIAWIVTYVWYQVIDNADELQLERNQRRRQYADSQTG